jgi:hypothetical protein
MIPVIQRFVVSKTGVPADCEDAVFISDNFAAVVDGATTPEIQPPTARSGRIAAQLLVEALGSLPADIAAHAAVGRLNSELLDWYRASKRVHVAQEDPTQRASASVIIFSRYRREVWSVGDCTVRIGDRSCRNESSLERVAAEARSVVLEAALVTGSTIYELAQRDPGRAAIEPLLHANRVLRNARSEYEYAHPGLDGFLAQDYVPEVYVVPDEVDEIVLASDGYPIVERTLEESERRLEEILREDPLCFRLFKATKGRYDGALSFDDRAYLRISV